MDDHLCIENLVNTASTKNEASPARALNPSLDNCVVSFQSELPVQLQAAMVSFIESYPNWDQYRLIQAALAGFLVQNGVDSRPIIRLYLGNMFGSDSFVHGV